MLKKCWGAFLEPSKDPLWKMRILLAVKGPETQTRKLVFSLCQPLLTVLPLSWFSKDCFAWWNSPVCQEEEEEGGPRGGLFLKRCSSDGRSRRQSSCCHVWLFLTPWAVTRQAPLSVGFSRLEYWSELPFPSPGDLPNPEIQPASL